MIQPTEEVPGEFGHPAWKRNVFAASVTCLVGVAMIVSYVLAIFGIIVLAIGFTWAVAAFIVGAMQERGDARRVTSTPPQQS